MHLTTGLNAMREGICAAFSFAMGNDFLRYLSWYGHCWIITGERQGFCIAARKEPLELSGFSAGNVFLEREKSRGSDSMPSVHCRDVFSELGYSM